MTWIKLIEFKKNIYSHIKDKGQIFLILNLLILCCSLACEDDNGSSNSGLSQAGDPILIANPSRIVLNAIPIGQSTTRAINIRNGGAGELRIINIEFSNELSGLEFSKEHPELPIRLYAEESVDLTVIYSPTNAGADRGRLILESNSREGRITEIEIETDEGITEPQYEETQLFTLTACDQEVSRWIFFQNLGTVPIVLTDLQITPNSSPAFSLGNRRIKDAMGTIQELETDELPEIVERSTFEVEVIYRRLEGEGDALGTLEFYTLSQTEPYRLDLRGASLDSQIQSIPSGLEFGAFDIGEESEIKTIQLQNNGSTTVTIESVDLAINDPNINAQFTLYDVEAPFTLNPDVLYSFGVNYHPTVEGVHRTAVSVELGECEGQVAIPIGGRVKQPCIQVTPELVNFGRIAQGQPSAPNRIEILNCGDADLEVTEVLLEQGNFEWNWVDNNTTLPFTLQTRMTRDIDVRYINQNLAEGVVDQATLQILNTSPETPELQVPLTVTGGGQATCDVRILPDQLNFGLISRGRTRTMELQAVNIGTGSCQLRGQTVEPLFDLPFPGFNDVRFTITRSVMGNEIATGQFISFEITYTPAIFNIDGARYVLTYFDPFNSEEREAISSLQGVSGESNIEVIPSRLDFGQVTAGNCASQEERVTVYNTGVVDLCITDITFEGDQCSEFLMIDRPIADAEGCIVVTRNQPAEVKLVYEPGDLGIDGCDLVFTSDASDSPSLRVPLEGEGVSNTHQVDEFIQTSGQTVDVLFVIDNSGSMQEEQENLQENFAEFITGAQQFQNDYQLGIITTDMDSDSHQGRLVDPRILRRNPSIVNQFQDAVDVGTNGAGTEKGLDAAKAALSDPLAFDTGVACQSDGECVQPDLCIEGSCGGHNSGFIRENAALELVFVSDEDDFSDGNLNFYVDFLKNIKGFRNEGLFRANAIVGAENGRATSCSGSGGDASAGDRYVEVANRTNGRVFSICSSDFGIPLQEIGNSAFGLPVQFFLTRPATANSIEISVSGQPQTQGWSYDTTSNSVIFEEASVPQPDEVIRIEYDAQCFPRQMN